MEESHNTRSRLMAVAMAAVLGLGGMTGVACDREDEKDLEEIGDDVEKGAKDVGEDVEDTVDEDVDTDGKDD